MYLLKRAAAFAALFLFCSTVIAAAQDVMLTSRDGKIEVAGTLLGFDGEFYRVQTDFGELTFDGSGVLCTGPGCPNLDNYVAELQISGSATMGAVLMPALLEAFGQRAGFTTTREDLEAGSFVYHLYGERDGELAANFSFRATNTNEGFADLLADEADVVMALREIRLQERINAREAGMGDLTGANRSRVLALDAIVPVVAPSNPVDRISVLDLARIYSGRIVSWKDLGGPDAPIEMHLPDEGNGLAQAIVDQIMTPAKLELAEGIIRHRFPADLSDAVAKDSFAIGLTSFAEQRNTKMLALAGTCDFALSASRRTIKTEDYPLTAPMFLYFPARRLPQIAREFLAFTRSPAAQVVIRRSGFVDQGPEEIPVDEQGNRFTNAIATAGFETSLDELQRMVTTLAPMQRLTVSFRFEAGSIRLDAQSRSNIQQLARAMEQGQYDARQILFVGFSDGEGPAAANRDIALQRAQAVSRAVLAAAVTANPERIDIGVEAFGEALPMACDDSAWGRQANRRVEVWVR
ncbi:MULTISPECIES: phosphate ABC transporter substrate-binding/OmpA family protein [unclassified Sulfitobacter]|uniref:phosphate ABC transporter substrate-binding/OmpA family protein n=1 Tax=unclassified Sulfitobacter TaxID=196795 RepID=UPI0007C3B1DD|nr:MULTISPECIES: phosphate ABC transporter substrate-binding/OmpA family protein [unclassified Sulfitobacter]KZX98207.1 cell envelope biogenesis protein OmpA [Sulfitobacter sp. HI0023]KZY25229.1 cell envelope biogenesis protein OmpA [Sulfitobacter sp. HI0040]KZZ62716.1 cell envelope biogenesis protein OmpA [Sulfitobacter sp. HI0129]